MVVATTNAKPQLLRQLMNLLGVQEEDMMVYDDLTAAEIREKLGQLQPVIAPR